MTKQPIFSKRKLFVALSVIILVVFTACGSSNEKRFKDAAMSLNNTRHTLTDEFDYWPECGIRVTGSHLASLISLNDLQKMLPCPLYVSGPHHDGQWDLGNVEEFGHYNPEAIQYLADLAEKVVEDKEFVERSKPLVDKYLYRQMHIMMVLHDAVYDEETFDKDTREIIFREMLEGQGYGDEYAYYLLYMLNLDDDSYVYSNIGNQFLYFWARRWSDGTIDQFYQGLSTIFKAYHPEYEYNVDRYWINENEMGDEYWYEGDEYEVACGETEYDCDLEADEPIENKERIKQKEAVGLIRTAITNLDKSNNVLKEFDYWPECGLRITGSHLFSLLSLRTLNRMLPCELYVSGPHHYNRWELNCPYEFGHYNPEAVRYLGQLASNVVADEQFVEQTRPLVDMYLKRQMFILMELYDGLNDKDLCGDKQEVLDNIMSLRGQAYGDTPSGFFLNQLDIEDGSYVYSNTGEMFLYFWARRNVDGTMEMFHDALKTIYLAYYPDYKFYH